MGLGLDIAAGIAACIAAGIVTFGIGAAICALIIAVLATLGAFAGSAVGGLVGAFIGWLIDEISDFDRLRKTLEANSNYRLFITERWVADISHERNEIDDIESVSVVYPRIDVPKQPLPMTTIAAAGIGRQPTGGGSGAALRSAHPTTGSR